MDIDKLAQEIIDSQIGFTDNIEESTINNTYFRKVLYTGKHSQLVLMSLKPGEEIGEETHNVDQFFRVEAGSGIGIVNETEYTLSDGVALIVPSGATHNVIADDDEGLKLYSIYSPPEHKDGIVHKTKAVAKEEHFDGTTTE